MANKYAAPTKEELASFNKKEDVNPETGGPESSPDSSSLMKTLNESSEDILRGGGQGLTFGLSDEAIAGGKTGIKAISDLFGGDLQKAQDYFKYFRQKQQEEQAANEASAERSPYLYHGAELVGGVVPAVATAGAGAAPIAAQSIKMAALKGLGAGAVAGFGGSKGTIEGDPATLARDTSLGGTLGLVLGAGGQKLFGKAANEVEKTAVEQLDNPFTSQLGHAYEQGRGGTLYTNKMSDLSRDVAAREGITNDALSAINKPLLAQNKGILQNDLQRFPRPDVKERLTNIENVMDSVMPNRAKPTPLNPYINKIIPSDVEKGIVNLGVPKEDIQFILQNLRQGGENSVKAQGMFDNVLNQLKRTGVDTDAIAEQITKGADEFAVQQKGRHWLTGSLNASNPKSIIRGTATGAPIKAANIAGHLVTKAEESLPGRGASWLYTAGKDALSEGANVLKNTPGLENLGSALENGLAEGSASKRNAILFSILQNPQAREVLGIDLTNKFNNE